MPTEATPALGPDDALLMVDVQRDFCPGGAVPVPGGDKVVAPLNEWSRAAASAGALIVASRDWHPPGHVSFSSQGGTWPEHCIQGSEGAALHPSLRLPPGAVTIAKGRDPARDAYSAFDGTELTTLLEARGVRRLFVGGLAQDVCVRSTVLDALRLGLEVHVLLEATRPVDEAKGRRALDEMHAGGAILEGGAPLAVGP